MNKFLFVLIPVFEHNNTQKHTHTLAQVFCYFCIYWPPSPLCRHVPRTKRRQRTRAEVSRPYRIHYFMLLFVTRACATVPRNSSQSYRNISAFFLTLDRQPILRSLFARPFRRSSTTCVHQSSSHLAF